MGAPLGSRAEPLVGVRGEALWSWKPLYTFTQIRSRKVKDLNETIQSKIYTFVLLNNLSIQFYQNLDVMLLRFRSNGTNGLRRLIFNVLSGFLFCMSLCVFCYSASKRPPAHFWSMKGGGARSAHVCVRQWSSDRSSRCRCAETSGLTVRRWRATQVFMRSVKSHLIDDWTVLLITCHSAAEEAAVAAASRTPAARSVHTPAETIAIRRRTAAIKSEVTPWSWANDQWRHPAHRLTAKPLTPSSRYKMQWLSESRYAGQVCSIQIRSSLSPDIIL